MSWDNTVRCSYCYAKGHNKAGCADLRDAMTKRLKAHPDDWRATAYFAKKKRSSKRTCSYCGHMGHNRKTCRELKHAKEVTVAMAAEWRNNALEYMKRIGLGIGALVRYERYGTPTFAVVTSINWDGLDHRHKFCPFHEANAFGLSDLGSDMSRVNHTVSLPMDETSTVTRTDYTPYRPVEIVSPVPPNAVQVQVPANWLKGSSSVGVLFDKNTKPYNVDGWVEKQNFYQEK